LNDVLHGHNCFFPSPFLQDDKEALLSKFRERLEAAVDVPEAARKVVEEELHKLEHLEKNRCVCVI
jgi:predicted metal-binding protein